MAKRVKLADVARAAGVSQGTASNAFSRPEVVRPEVRERIAAAAAELGYAGPDPKGRLLRAGRVNAIGVVVSQNMTDFFSDPYNREFMAGISQACDAHGAGIALIAAKDKRNVAWSIGSAVVDGFILSCVADGERLLELARKRKLPFVATDTDAGPDVSSLDIDNYGGARAAAEHLTALGHRRVGILSLDLGTKEAADPLAALARHAPGSDLSVDRLRGYLDGLTAAGVDPASVPVFDVEDEAHNHRQAATDLLDAHPGVTAVLAMSDVIALAALEVAKTRALRVPTDLSVMGFDDIPEAAAAGLTTVHQPIVEKGRRAAELILEGGAPRKEVLPVSLVVRSSTAAPRSR